MRIPFTCSGCGLVNVIQYRIAEDELVEMWNDSNRMGGLTCAICHTEFNIAEVDEAVELHRAQDTLDRRPE